MITFNNGHQKIIQVKLPDEIKEDTNKELLRITYIPEMPLIITTDKKDAEYIQEQVSKLVTELGHNLIK